MHAKDVNLRTGGSQAGGTFAAKIIPVSDLSETPAGGNPTVGTSPELSAATTKLYRTGDDDDTNSNGSSSSKRIVSMKEIGYALGKRTRIRRYNFWLKFYACLASICWNVASPIKSYVLSFYGLPGDDLVFSHNLNWTMEVDYDYARALYDNSGIKYTAAEGKPIRFINMYLDFVVFNRANIWAKNLDDYQQDPYVGLFCRTSLVMKKESIDAERRATCVAKSYLNGNNYLEQSTCRVNEVSEAVMCLKGIDVLKLMNYEWQSTLGRDDALQQLTQELATNYSLDPIGFGGKKGLYTAFHKFEGFTDLSGKPSGVRYSKMAGSIPERTQPFEPDLNALVLGRERLWWLVGETPQNFRDQVLGFSFFAPYFFVGMHINNSATSNRFVERYAIEDAGQTGICQDWALRPTAKIKYPGPVYLETDPQSSVLSGYGYKHFGPRAREANNVTDPAQISKLQSLMSTICLARDECLDLCQETLAGGWLTTFDRSGLCQKRAISQTVLNRQGYIDWKCFGEGTGKDTLSVKILEPITRSDGSTFQYSRVKNVTNPGAIVACVLGGRIPQAGDEPYPNILFDLLEAGANTIVTTTFSRGTEKVLVNVYALVSLVGCAVFSVWVMQNLLRVVRMLVRVKKNGLTDSRGAAQLLDSVFTVNLSTVAHGRNIQLSKVILWLNLVTWYIGAADSNCTWWVNGVDLWSQGATLQSYDSPYYKCKPGVFVDHLSSFIGCLRLLSISYNFYSLTCQHLILRGATRYARPFLSPILVFGLLPTFLGSVAITGINHLRLHWGILSALHNQLFLVLLWVAYLFGYHELLQNKTIGRLYVDFLCKAKLCGKQKLKIGSVVEAIVGPYYLTLPEFVIKEEVEWIPLSVALESPTFDMEKLDFGTRRYRWKTRTKGQVIKPVEIPQWVLDDDEFFFC